MPLLGEVGEAVVKRQNHCSGIGSVCGRTKYYGGRIATDAPVSWMFSAIGLLRILAIYEAKQQKSASPLDIPA